MRHRKAHRKFSRDKGHRKALFRNLATALLEKGQIKTTLAKAKDLRSVVEKLITTAKEDTVHRRRKVYNFITKKSVVHKLFAEIGPKYRDRPGGYTRVFRLGKTRAGDSAPMAVIQLVPKEKREDKRKRREKGAAEATTSKEAEVKLESKKEEQSKELAKESEGSKGGKDLVSEEALGQKEEESKG